MSTASSPLEALIKETKASFMIAKSDGVLDLPEVIQIAVEISQKVQKIAGLSGSEKKAMLLMALRKGLETSGGVGSLPGFGEASAETKQAFEDQLINAASLSIDMVLSAASGKLDLRKPSSWMQCLPVCMGLAKTIMSQKDTVVLEEAKKAVEDSANVSVTAVTMVTEEVTATGPTGPTDPSS
jgi:hypothetical protein